MGHARIEVDIEPLYRPAEARAKLEISQSTLDRWCQNGTLTVYRTAGGETGIRWAHRRFLVAEVDKLARIREAKRTHPKTRAGYPKQPRRPKRPKPYWWLNKDDPAPPRERKEPEPYNPPSGLSGHSGSSVRTTPVRVVGDTF